MKSGGERGGKGKESKVGTKAQEGKARKSAGEKTAKKGERGDRDE